MCKLILYGLDPSPPTRACLLTLKALNLRFQYVKVDLLNKEHMSAEFVAKNPQRTVPLLNDNGKYIWESHAIMAFLVRKYGRNDALYPGDFLLRATVDQRLYFNCSVFFHGVLRAIVRPLIFDKNPNIPLSKIEDTEEVYGFMEIFLKENDFIAGNNLTIADFSLISTMSSAVAWLEVDADKYPKLTAWMKRMQALPYYEEANGKGAAQFCGMFKAHNPVVVLYNGL